ncbi:MAG TPA: alpha/beta hydrolase [Anaerolineae bacterium]
MIPIVSTLVALIALGFVVTRKGPAWKLRWQFVRAFRAGRKFYATYPHIAKDIAYGDRPRQKLDVYWPPSGERLPVMLFVHGGSWSWGDKTLYPLVAAHYAPHGFVVVVINYSHYPHVTFPTFVEDAAAAIAWVVRHIDAYHGDPDRLVASGHSAGGHILSLIALDERYLAAHGLTRDVLRGLIAISAPTDLGLLVQHLQANLTAASAEVLIAIMGGSDRLPQADPIHLARRDAPPIQIVHGVEDTLVPIEVARRFAAALKAAGAPVELLEYERADHYSILLDGARPRSKRPTRLLLDSVEFMQRVTQQL